jgi:hypothetical protein
MTTENKYTLGEVGAIAVISPFVVALLLVFAIPFALWQAYVGTILWNWFPAVYFHLNPISLWMTLGIVYTRSVFVSSVSYKNHEVEYKSEIGKAVLGPAFALLLGYLIHHFMM